MNLEKADSVWWGPRLWPFFSWRPKGLREGKSHDEEAVPAFFPHTGWMAAPFASTWQPREKEHLVWRTPLH